MNEETSPLTEIAQAGRRSAEQILNLGANRLELLVVEAQEARERLLQTFLFALGVAVFALLAALTLSAGIVILCWPLSPIGALAILTFLYAGAAVWLDLGLNRLRYEWQAFADTLEQLRKDCKCLANILH